MQAKNEIRFTRNEVTGLSDGPQIHTHKHQETPATDGSISGLSKHIAHSGYILALLCVAMAMQGVKQHSLQTATESEAPTTRTTLLLSAAIPHHHGNARKTVHETVHLRERERPWKGIDARNLFIVCACSLYVCALYVCIHVQTAHLVWRAF